MLSTDVFYGRLQYMPLYELTAAQKKYPAAASVMKCHKTQSLSGLGSLLQAFDILTAQRNGHIPYEY